MLRHIDKVAIIVFILLFGSFFYASAQEKQDSRDQAMQLYLEKEGSYSQAPQQEPGAGLQTVEPIPSPSTAQFIERVQQQQEQTTAIAVPSEIEFTERVERGQEKTLAPAKGAKRSESLKEKLEKKKREEKKKKEEKEKKAGLTEVVAEPEPPAETEERQYYLDIGDVLDISVWELPTLKEQPAEEKIKQKEGKDYYIDIGDTLDVFVWQVPDLSRPGIIVRPDGKVSYPLIGDIKAEGLTLTQLDEEISEKLKAYVKTPEVSIMITHFGRLGDQTGKPGGVSKRSDLSVSGVIIRPDGKVSYPLIGDIKAEGLTLTQLDELITEKLKPYIKIPDVSIMITRFGEQTNKVVILGEIPGPGVYKFNAPPTIIEAIASAGGYTKYAVLNSIIVIRGDLRTKPQAIRVNLVKIIKSHKLSENIYLKPNDIVYVPRSFIGNVNVFLELLQPAFAEYMQTMNARYLQRTLHRK